MSERRVYVYRVTWEIPPECSGPDFVPTQLLESEGPWRDWDENPFTWPSRHLYFSWDSAQRRASKLRSWGAIVRVERSPVDDWQPVAMWWEQIAEEAAR